MSFTYDPALSAPLDNIRFLIQDTDPDDYDFENEEVEALYTMNNNVYETGKELAMRLWIKYSKAPSKVEVDGVRIDNPKRGETYKSLYETLEDLAKKNKAGKSKQPTIFFGGVDRSRYNDNRNDQSRVRPKFTDQQVVWNKRHPELSPIDKDAHYYEDYLDDRL